MHAEKVIKHIVNWLSSYSEKAGTRGFVIGVSGGIDSAVTSSLCALTGLRVIALNLPIRQFRTQIELSNLHISWLKQHHSNVEDATVDLSPVLECLSKQLPLVIQDQLTMANTRSRLRMTSLYAFATHHKLLVAGTGNKVEDFGVGFFTKYGDGGVDLSPIADLNKSEVYELGKTLGIAQAILDARPTDGLFEDGRSDEDEIGASYPELEWAMEYDRRGDTKDLNPRQQTVLEIYRKRHTANRHKMEPIPVCMIPKAFR
ncbi:MAG TPA: NAD(+) synthase [Bacteroidia bacterium]|nr:NAD(+) synthase [Bacteroidia bacterium]